MKNAYFYDTMIGRVLIAEDGEGITNLCVVPKEYVTDLCAAPEEGITNLCFVPEKGVTKLYVVPEEGISEPDASCILNTSYVIRETGLLSEAAVQLKEYLEGKRKAFDIKLNPAGTHFMHSVWEALRAIPYGQVRSYSQVAEAIGNPKAYRAVGMACHNNPILCMIPCHRVVGADGSLTGFAAGLAVKNQLLMLEQGKEK